MFKERYISPIARELITRITRKGHLAGKVKPFETIITVDIHMVPNATIVVNQVIFRVTVNTRMVISIKAK